MAEIDWLQSTTEMRQILYRHLQLEMARKNLTLAKLMEQTLGSVPVGKGYDANMRAGKYSRKYAGQFYNWLEANNPAEAKAVEASIAEVNHSSKAAWSRLLGLERRPLTILAYDPATLGAARFPSLLPIYEIARGKPFYFQFISGNTGSAIGFQKQNRVWHFLPLDRNENTVSVSPGRVELPKHKDGRNIDPIAEEEARDLLEFLIVVSTKTDFVAPDSINEAGVINIDALDEFADQVLSGEVELFANSLLVT